MMHVPSGPDSSGREPDIDPQGLWQAQKKEYDSMTLAAIHEKARARRSSAGPSVCVART